MTKEEAISINSMVETIATKVTEDTEKFIFETITPYCEEITKREISKKDLERALTQYFSKEPCDDAISREAAINIASLHCLTIDETVKAIKNLPSVTQKSGKWIEHPEIETSAPEYLMFYECSECGNKPCFCKSDIHKKRFCSNCGARMVEPQESEDKE